MSDFRGAIDSVLARDSCSGCGLCATLDDGIDMRLNADGYIRPVYARAEQTSPDALDVFRRSCPGVTVRAPAPPQGAAQHPLFGPIVGIWRAWASDTETRRAGSSGGVLTALHAWLIAEGRAAHITGAGSDPSARRRTVPVTIMTRAQAIDAAGSRYAPVAALSNADVLNADVVTAKPCEISALRQAAPDLIDGEPPLLLSFFCAGTPSQHATDTLLRDLGIAEDDPVEALRYRGDGWPGQFTATSGPRTVNADYDESWGKTLGPTTQWRCKLCPDGIGESADIVCADAWDTDEKGYPVFTEGEGVSALIARTSRGQRVIEEAARS
jgi:coenzyme F420 hydrogenase subunit beta